MAIEEFNEQRNQARVAAGFKGGPFNKPPRPPQRTIVEGWPTEVLQKLKAARIPEPRPLDVWNARRSNGNI